MKKQELKQLIKEQIRVQLKEAGGEERGTMEVVNTPTEKAYEYAKKQLPTLDKDIPDFKKNYELAQDLAGKGRTKRKDMPVIDDKDIQQFQTRLKKGYIDINEPFSPTYDKKDPYPQGLEGFDAEDFLERGLKDKSKKDDMVEVTIKQIRVGDLKPIQRQIYFDKSMNSTAKFGVEGTKKFITTKTFFVTSDDNYIIDGHHRFLSGLLIDPNMKVNCLSIDLPIKELLPLATAYGDAIGNKRNESRLRRVNESFYTRLADTDEQEESIKEIEKWMKKLGKSLQGGTPMPEAPHPTTTILDLTYNGSEIYIDTDGSIEVYGEPVSDFEDFKQVLKDNNYLK